MPAPLICPNCASHVSSFDQYCGVCGAVLARLRWGTPEEKAWYSTDGYVAVRRGAKSALVRFRNEGVVPAGLVLRAEHIAELPDWIDREELAKKVGEQTLVLLPSADEASFTELEIPLVTARLAPLFEEEDSAAPRALEREAYLPFLTNLNDWQDGRWTSRPFKLTLLAARRPWISPARSHYRFLPIERLEGGGLEHRIELHNETIQAIELFEVQIKDDPDSKIPDGYARLPAGALLSRAPFEQQQRIAAGESWSDVLRLAIPERSGEATLQWFAALVEYQGESVEGKESYTIPCWVQGRVGRGPTLRTLGPASLMLSEEQIQHEHSFTIENPGQIPVAVESLEILREVDDQEEPAPERDWLALTGLAAGDVLKPGEVRTLVVRIRRSLRPQDEFEEDECQRIIRIKNDGIAGPARSLKLEVFVHFGKAEEFPAGIDFGTTNSVVCVGGTRRAYPLRLELDAAGPRDRIRSLLYFDPSARSSIGEPFLFGEEAFNSAAIRPENLVRSIKTVVARDPRTRYVFYKRTPGAGDERVTRTPQDLLSLFIAELRARAELGVRYLPIEAYGPLGLDYGTEITLSRAVFSHPVEILEEARRALMEAAHRAGISEYVREVEEFFEQSCIDEATAAVLAYVQGRVQPPPILDAPPTDCERVLCFDMGGGTTDLATVEVLQMAAYVADDQGDTRVVVNLEAKAGARFGGDDLDELLAFLALEDLQNQNEKRGTSIELEDFKRAVKARSRWDFSSDYKRRHGVAAASGAESADARLDNEAYDIFKQALAILFEVEKAKIELSALPESEDFKPFSLRNLHPLLKGQEERDASEVKVQLRRADFEEKVREELAARLPLLDSVVRGASWEWPSVTTLLLTGQSSRVPVIQKEVVRHVMERRGPDAPPLLLIEPGHPNFDPKNCVAIGAAIWGANRTNGSWLEIRNRVRERLTFDLATRMGGVKLRPVQGLKKGDALPATGVVSVAAGASDLKLYRDGSEEYHVRFRFSPLPKASDLTVRVDGPGDYTVIVGGREIKGKVKT